MKAGAVTALITGLKQAGINFVASLPSRSLTTAIHTIMNDTDFIHVPVGNERDAIGICAGAYLGGKKPAFMGENAGLVLGTYALLHTIHSLGGIPMLLVLDHRGDFGEQDGHFYYGSGIQLPRILESFQIHYTIVRESDRLIAEVASAVTTAEVYRKPAAILLSGEEMYGN